MIAALLGSMVSCCPKAAEPIKKDIGVQLYSLREMIGNPEKYAQNHEEVFKALAEYGYTSVEAASYNEGKFYGVAPKQFKADVEAAGLKVLSSHVGRGLSDEELKSGDFSAPLEWWKECIAAHKAAGMEYIVVPAMRTPETLEGLGVYCNYYNQIGALCKENGIKFGYHNHSFEFRKVEDQVMLDYMIANTDPEMVFFQMDVYWTVRGASSPVEYFKKYPGRFKMLHIKDHREIGQSGMVGFDAIFANTDIAGTNDLIVEIEAFTNGDWRESMKMCADYLLGASFVKPSYK